MADDSIIEGIEKTVEGARKNPSYKRQSDFTLESVRRSRGAALWEKPCSQLKHGDLCAVYACFDHVQVVVYCNGTHCDDFYNKDC
jgi:hypothetical protein